VVFEKLNLSLDKKIESLGRTLGEELLEPTTIYVKPVRTIIAEFHVHGISHITGGGLVDNIPRILPANCQAVIHKGSWEIPPIFSFIQEKGAISESEMLRTFNSGIGMVLVMPDEEANDVMARLHTMHVTSYLIGEIRTRKEGDNDILFT
jgi:phosphoribosylformylglycinamidine cyclo-ligase